jgi:tRNA dimethylallyltransferase
MPGDRAHLHQRIATRFNQMLAHGLVNELDELRRNFELNPQMPAMRSVGYRQAWEYLDGRLNQASLTEKGIAATRQLAKRQMTWLRSMAGAELFDSLDEGAPAAILDRSEQFLAD